MSRRKFFAIVPLIAAKSSTISAADFRVLIAIAHHADERGEGAYPSMATIAELTGMLRGDIPRAVRRLERAGLIATSRRGKGNLYTVWFDEKAMPETVSKAADNEDGLSAGSLTSLSADLLQTVSEAADQTVPNSPFEQVPPSEGADAPALLDLQKPLYDLGKEVLGPKSGGQITNLVRHCAGDVGATMRTLRLAQTKSDPAEYVGAILRGQRRPETTDWDAEYRRMGVSL